MYLLKSIYRLSLIAIKHNHVNNIERNYIAKDVSVLKLDMQLKKDERKKKM